jgi:hypothetical protein
MASNSIRFKNMFVAYNVIDRANIVNRLCMWVGQVQTDPKIQQFVNFLAQLQGLITLSKKELEGHWIWSLANSLEDCVSFQQVVKNKLAIPNKVDKKDVKTRKTIPKKTREAVWKRDCGDSISGKCYCCLSEVNVLATWHAGHIIANANGGTDTEDNLRVVCPECNLAMGVENMEDFKKRCYPSK